MKKRAPFCLLLFLGLSGTLGTQALYAQETLSSSQLPCIPASHARKFGSLVLLNPNGRLEPVNSYTSAILRKLYGADKLNNINSDQFFLNLRFSG